MVFSCHLFSVHNMIWQTSIQIDSLMHCTHNIRRDNTHYIRKNFVIASSTADRYNTIVLDSWNSIHFFSKVSYQIERERKREIIKIKWMLVCVSIHCSILLHRKHIFLKNKMNEWILNKNKNKNKNAIIELLKLYANMPTMTTKCARFNE